ncbi:fibro-slime domain-containing protein [Colidextribacter sp. OB.20]|uniref:fibro-slime domain-containing protein n=1 Tax=Colidextribacter sp. OB.20 TaxID=2304568 RepID=UPI0013688CA5|nr:fibro-slime domain-containing protein [Colidextribacter sp. OB.20]NBI09542.1 fibro-slime domain-containing protein [Colidextribacter sp. OB.20]
MGRNFAVRVQYYLTTRRQNRRRAAVLRCLAFVVAIATAYALIMPAVTQSNALLCGKEAHVHTEECWTEELVPVQPELVCAAGQDGETVVHTHESSCYDRNGELICPLRERELHIHNTDCYREFRELICEERQVLGHAHGPSCYTYVRGELTCGLEESAGHTHSSACYRTELSGTPDCGLTEGGGHVHSDACYKIERGDVPSCGLESEGHVHTDGCYTEEQGGAPDCGKTESEGHTHTDECYTEEEKEVLTCGQKESGGHTHTDACYPVEEVLTCGLEEDGEHTHTGGCYTEKRSTEPDCGKKESEGHAHTGGCYETKTERTLTCGQKESKGHTHSDACYPTERTLTCTQEEGGEHVHTDACYPEKRTLICEEKTGGHTHTDACYPEEKILDCQEEERGHTHTDVCYDWTQEMRCQEEERESGHVHTDECYEITELLSCREEELILHEHTEECYEITCNEETGEIEDQELICDKPEVILHQHSDDCFLTPEGDPVETRVLTCDREEHTHVEECYVEIIPKEEEDSYLCGQKEHVHMDDCYFESGKLRCTLPEHIHSVDCLEEPPELVEIPEEPMEPRPTRIELDDYFSYDTDAFHATFHITGIATLGGGEESAPPSLDSGNGQQPEGPAAEPDVDDTGAASPDEPAGPADGGSSDAGTASSDEADIERGDAGDTSGGDSSAGGVDEDGSVISGDIDVPLAAAPDWTEDSDWADSPEWEGEPIKIEFHVNEPDQDSPEYRNITAAVPESEAEQIVLSVLTFSVTASDGREVDLSRCSIEAEVEFTQELVDALVNMGSETMTIDNEDGEAQSPESAEVRIAALAEEAGEADAMEQPSEVGTLVLDTVEPSGNPAVMYFNVSPQSRSVLFTAQLGQFPEFTVEYYANLNRPAKRGDAIDGKQVSTANVLPFIDTSGGILPQNGKDYDVNGTNGEPRSAELLLDDNGNVIFVKEMREIFQSSTIQYNPIEVEKLTTEYLGKVVSEDGAHYELTEVRIYPDGATEENENDPAAYTPYTEDVFNALNFTNSAKTAYDTGAVLITNNTVIRMVYETSNEGTTSYKATFYDYDITNGKQDTKGGYYTGAEGINSRENSDAADKFAFGGANTGTYFGENKRDGSLINKLNTTSRGAEPGKDGYKGCSFGLVGDYLKDGVPDFKMAAPEIFGGEGHEQVGKYYYDDYSLQFNREGDTYTLSAVNGTGTTGLEKFRHPDPKYPSIWTNNFWPMDSIYANAPADNKGKDPLFGNRTKVLYHGENDSTSEWTAFPTSDDFQSHNSYFGMSFAVTFTLQKEYVGPLEYYFYGDDDMWVYLDGKLVCDIGGVHSSVGEYVNLWDYISIDRESNESHRLDFFYTERGASGSTCWMQFTIPNMIPAPQYKPPTAEANYLRIEKQVEGDETRMDQEFNFNLKINGDGSTFNVEKYKVNEAGEEEKIEDEALKEGVTGNDEKGLDFTLKSGEYLLVYPIPATATYKLTEKTDGLDNCKTSFQVNGGDAQEGSSCGGSMTNGDQTSVEVLCTNTFYYQLPETGGLGSNLYIWAGAALIAAGCLWYKRRVYRGGARNVL